MYTIHYSNGQSPVDVTTLQDALDHLTAEYPAAVFVTDDGIDLICEDATTDEDLRSRDGARVLCWADEASSRNDDGAHAVASIRWD
jgi:hypothetical protein